MSVYLLLLFFAKNPQLNAFQVFPSEIQKLLTPPCPQQRLLYSANSQLPISSIFRSSPAGRYPSHLGSQRLVKGDRYESPSRLNSVFRNFSSELVESISTLLKMYRGEGRFCPEDSTTELEQDWQVQSRSSEALREAWCKPVSRRLRIVTVSSGCCIIYLVPRRILHRILIKSITHFIQGLCVAPQPSFLFEMRMWFRCVGLVKEDYEETTEMTHQTQVRTPKKIPKLTYLSSNCKWRRKGRALVSTLSTHLAYKIYLDCELLIILSIPDPHTTGQYMNYSNIFISKMNERRRANSVQQKNRPKDKLNIKKHTESFRKLSQRSDLDRIGPYLYSKTQLLGAGFTSNVYKAWHEDNMDKEYALKVIDLTRFDKDQVNMLSRELEIHHQLVHPNVVSCYNTYETEHQFFLVLEYCPHGDLAEFIHKNQVSEELCISILQQLIEGQKYLLSEKVMHRDLKPCNIFRSGNTWKIGDFGFAVRGKKSFMDVLSVGTPLYMPPESVETTYYSYKSDIFSLGVLTYELLFKRTPWYSQVDKELLQKMQQQTLDLSSIRTHYLRAFISKCCQMQEHQRIGREEFMDLQLKQLTEEQVGTDFHRFLRSPEKKRPRAGKKLVGSSTTIEQSIHELDETIVQANTSVLQKQLNYCRHIYNTLDNIHFLKNTPDSRQIYGMTVCKYLHFMLIKLSSKANELAMRRWEDYVRTTQYRHLQQQVADLKKKTVAKMQRQDWGSSIKNIKYIHQQFPELSHNGCLTIKLYQNLTAMVLSCINQQSNQIKVILKQDIIGGILSIHGSLNGHYQMLESLVQLYQVVSAKKASNEHEYQIWDNINMKDRSLTISIVDDFSKSPLIQKDFRKIQKTVTTLNNQ